MPVDSRVAPPPPGQPVDQEQPASALVRLPRPALPGQLRGVVADLAAQDVGPQQPQRHRPLRIAHGIGDDLADQQLHLVGQVVQTPAAQRPPGQPAGPARSRVLRLQVPVRHIARRDPVEAGGEQRDVVVPVTRAEHVQHVVAQGLQRRRMVRAGELRGRREALPQLLDARPHVPQPRLHQTVGVEEQRGAGRGVQLDGLEVDAAHPDRGARRHHQHLGPPAQVQQHGRRMSGVGDGDPVRDRIVDGVQAGRHPVAAQALRLLVQVVQDLLRRQVELRQGLRRRPELAHDRRRGHGVAHHIADDQRDPAAGQRDRVIPVAADTGRLGRREVARGEPDAGGLGERVGQHRALQLVGDVGLAPVQHGLVDAERGVRRQLCRDQQIAGLERGALGAAHEHRGPDDPAPAAQRGEDRPVPGGDGPAGAEQLRQGGPRRG
ncbi:hypothetical protein GCM10010342_15550 [Streptomyces anulatus]|nr:hypothetical protein GCM10010342_15550 [Streptomyces anulatus]